jgi:hypothetical protein
MAGRHRTVTRVEPRRKLIAVLPLVLLAGAWVGSAASGHLGDPDGAAPPGHPGNPAVRGSAH